MLFKNMFTSPRFKLACEEAKKVFYGMLIAGAGAVLTYLQDAIPAIDFGNYTIFAVFLNMALVNSGRKLLTRTMDEEQLKKLMTGIAMGALGCVATYLQSKAGSGDIGSYGPMLVAVNSTMLNFLRIWVSEHGKLI